MPGELRATDLDRELVLAFTDTYGAGTLYTLCRDASDPKWKAQNISHACDLGTQCCGYLGSPGRAGKLPDTCVRASEAMSECPRTAIGEEGAPCGLGGACNTERNLTCCDNIHFLGGLTSVKIPTCQHSCDGQLP
ncbi:hypothetical protein COHA_003425 [Chlorella ohadii]|uniref:Uncharacterized protein n=1 Tax=Chlorella ohadii TaxID=2649997 RepID=A0AAD5H3G6_9CHLO|nr:hypothetical protein COHA_003425 [Chlorella ohadii]